MPKPVGDVVARAKGQRHRVLEYLYHAVFVQAVSMRRAEQCATMGFPRLVRVRQNQDGMKSSGGDTGMVRTEDKQEITR
jgi:hypothetical protein